jgi:hypothetical protein
MSQRYWVTLKQLMGTVAKWSVQLSPYPAPDNLEKSLCLLQQSIRSNFDRTQMAPLSRDGLRLLLREHFFNLPTVQAWNNRKNGNNTPFKFVSVFDPKGANPDDDFIDLGALEANIVREIMCEAEEYPAR